MTLNELLELKYTNPSKYETALDAYYSSTNKCNDCGRNVPEEEYDSSLGHCLECHGG